ncbi:hypothetical protein PSTT_09441 [Puccinia striiformis]|uniref:Very-long-chain 3-oxoacyl-CoA reductase n=1 Tax=Puccinia striiformis TaxID=27350 RepID=A0A2S4V8D4_9BASI|nr:hypothetical protein PSTT_09441 [Puccinia striiformis]
MNFKATTGSVLLGSLSLIGLLTVLKYQLSFLNLLFCFSPLSKPFKLTYYCEIIIRKSGWREGERAEEGSQELIIMGNHHWTNEWDRQRICDRIIQGGIQPILDRQKFREINGLQEELLTKVNPTIEIEIETIDLSDNRRDVSGPVEEQTQGKEWTKILTQLKQISTRSNLSILINNAGLSHSEPIEFQMNDLDEDINSILNVNVFSVLYLTKLVIPFMLPHKKGLILNVGSFSALIPTPLLSTYAGSKGFLYTWSQALGTELEPKGIDVKLLNTYFVASEMSKIKKATFLIPTPNNYVKQVLNNLISTNSKPFITTGYFSHSLLEWFLDHYGSLKFWLKFNLNMQRSILKRIQKKKERIAKQNQQS